MNMQRFDAARRDRLRQEYDAAVLAGRDRFMFDGHELLVDYAKYLLEYLDSTLPAASWKVEVIADSSGKWRDNSVRTATKDEAERYARNLAHRWLLVQRWRVIPSDRPPNFKADEHGNLTRIGQLP